MIRTVTFSSNRFLYSLETLPFYCHLHALCVYVWTKIIYKKCRNGALILMIIIIDQERINPLMSHEKIKHVHKFLMGWNVEDRYEKRKNYINFFGVSLWSFFPFLIHWWLFKSSRTHAGIIIVLMLNFLCNIPGSHIVIHSEHRIISYMESEKFLNQAALNIKAICVVG